MTFNPSRDLHAPAQDGAAVDRTPRRSFAGRGQTICRTGMAIPASLYALFAAGTTMVVERGAGVSAYACAREFGHGVVIGPVVASGADGEADAMDRIAALAGRARGRFLRIDVTGSSGLSAWLNEMGLPCVGHAAPMVRDIQARAVGAADADARLFALSNQ